MKCTPFILAVMAAGVIAGPVPPSRYNDVLSGSDKYQRACVNLLARYGDRARELSPCTRFNIKSFDKNNRKWRHDVENDESWRDKVEILRQNGWVAQEITLPDQRTVPEYFDTEGPDSDGVVPPKPSEVPEVVPEAVPEDDFGFEDSFGRELPVVHEPWDYVGPEPYTGPGDIMAPGSSVAPAPYVFHEKVFGYEDTVGHEKAEEEGMGLQKRDKKSDKNERKVQKELQKAMHHAAKKDRKEAKAAAKKAKADERAEKKRKYNAYMKDRYRQRESHEKWEDEEHKRRHDMKKNNAPQSHHDAPGSHHDLDHSKIKHPPDDD